MRLTGLNHLTLAVSDLERSFSFYRELLGAKPMARWESGAYLTVGELWLCLSLDAAAGERPHPDYSHIAFTATPDEFPAWVERLMQAGVMVWKDSRSEGESFYFLDPDGHKLEIHVGSLLSRLAACREAPYRGMRFFDRDVE
ncbi:fosfomycin resistance glutathione transferase [Crenobacter sp. SG2303]|uniref:Fosfomycin resistance glutathione transferase n=1 Tax=Crenobacter oryzisoli TaxID=3056844 RepID=A0ABT7XJH7_9NEIS|nr:fosfomycin resistance glutathione transferase [Crenobacter sp. SG2303]MDN0073930.1 fosfomycin resistance glutathione transferase [Crenobacter sp. SG2303]